MHHLKAIQSKKFLRILVLVNSLFHSHLYDTLCLSGNAAAETIAPENKVVPAFYPLKARLMSVFCRSIAAANSFPSTLQCIFACIYGMFVALTLIPET